MPNRTLLIDADIIAYEVAARVEQTVEWSPGYFQTFCDFEEVKQKIQDRIDSLVEQYDCDDYKLALTDSEGNFRKDIWPEYKGNRTSTKKPIVLQEVKRWLEEDMDAYFRPRLEGDDILGILQTHKSIVKGERVIWSIDKDMMTIPGLHAVDGEIVEQTHEDAFRMFMEQVLTGDATDNYPGIPGYGPVKAKKWLDAVEAPTMQNLWRSVVDAYERLGMTEDDALIQARCARILTANLYDFKKKEVILWTPPS